MKVAILSMLSGSFDPYWSEVERGVNAAREHFEIDVEYLAPGPEVSHENDITRWQEHTARRIAGAPDVKAVAAAVLDAGRAPAIIKSITNAGIPCITFDTDAPQSTRSFFVGTNNRIAGNTCAYVLAKLIEFQGRIIIDTPSLTVNSCKQRIEGFREVMGRYARIEIVRQVCGQENEAAMRKAAEQTLGDIPDLKGIFCASGTSARINAEILQASGRAGQVKIVSMDAGKRLLELLRRDIIQMTVAQRPYSMGFRLMDFLYQIARRGLDTVMRGIPESRIVDTGIHQVTSRTLDSFLENRRKLQA
jgi:ribose transport system substrate-binding protein